MAHDVKTKGGIKSTSKPGGKKATVGKLFPLEKKGQKGKL